MGKTPTYGERHKKARDERAPKLLIWLDKVARLARFERATAWFVATIGAL